MAIQVSGTTVINDSRGLNNIASVDATTVTTLSNAGVGASPFQYDAVSGATQALDVGDYNFFDGGTLTADTTVSFSNVPTEARWTYTAEVGVIPSETWDLSTAFYIKESVVAVRDLTDIFFKPDGTKMYFVAQSNDAIDEYSLSIAWNTSTASYVRSFSVASQETNPWSVFFKPDGTKMYVMGTASGNVNEYSLSTAWDISTASYVRSFSVASQTGTAIALFFKPDGTTMYVTGSAIMYQYSLSTAWDISTASYVQSRALNSPVYLGPNLYATFFKPDGTVLFVITDNPGKVKELSLSTAWDIYTASYVRELNVSAQEPYPRGLFFKPDGTKMYLTGVFVDSFVNEYSTAFPLTFTTPASVQNPPSEIYLVGDQVSYEFFTADGGTTVTLIGEEIT